ncbi:MAG: hypothetical protein KKD44_21960 [Proteobacteria bacterium]|nr:hypothetical protein [Pseudomonadota bacterium]
MFKVDSDKIKNRLFITLKDLTPEDVTPILEALTKNISNLKPGFTCLVDIRSMELDSGAKGEAYIEIIQGALADSGMGKVVRVADKKNVAFHHHMEESSLALGYTATLAYTYDEAEKILDGK